MLVRHTALALCAVLAAAGVVGCAELLSIDDFQDSPGTGGEAATGGSGGGGTTGGGGSNSGSESCLDRVDNNSDGLADCEDPQCQATHQCAPPATDDWLGIGWLHPGQGTPDCGLAQRVELFDSADLSVPQATCTCACNPPVDASCEALLGCSLISCGGAANDTGWVGLQCAPFEITISQQDCSATNLRAVQGSCMPAGQIDHGPVDWQPAATLCLHPSGGHCAGSQTCIPSGAAAAQGPCVARAGEHDCPALYPEQNLLWGGTFDDGRTCDAGSCSCAVATGATCGCTGSPCGVRDFYADDCTGNDHDFASLQSQSCISFGAISGTPPWTFGAQLEGVSVTDPGSCAASGSSTLQGDVTPTERITVCCAAGST